MTEQPKLGRKADATKARWDLVPLGVMRQIVDVLTRGAVKYAAENWQFVPSPRARYYAAAQRHLDAWWRGEKNDPEWGCSHLAHAVCSLMFLMWFDDQADQEDQVDPAAPPMQGENEDEEAKDEATARAATTAGPRTALRRAEPRRPGDTLRR